jgi:hypothetical protein
MRYGALHMTCLQTLNLHTVQKFKAVQLIPMISGAIRIISATSHNVTFAQLRFAGSPIMPPSHLFPLIPPASSVSSISSHPSSIICILYFLSSLRHHLYPLFPHLLFQSESERPRISQFHPRKCHFRLCGNQKSKYYRLVDTYVQTYTIEFLILKSPTLSASARVKVIYYTPRRRSLYYKLHSSTITSARTFHDIIGVQNVTP